MQEDEWRKKLTPEQYRILREKGTETPFSGKLLDEKRTGLFKCAACEAVLFDSEHKFESGSGWPSFYDIAKSGAVEFQDDNSHGMRRVEVTCSTCGSHLGHVFPDDNAKTGKYYCINSVCLAFDPKQPSN
jgi:peptide-methionine (R)-S-oxide reductase